MRRRESLTDSGATTAAELSRTQSLPEDDSKRRWRRRDSITDRLFGKFKKDGRERSQSFGATEGDPATEQQGRRGSTGGSDWPPPSASKGGQKQTQKVAPRNAPNNDPKRDPKLSSSTLGSSLDSSKSGSSARPSPSTSPGPPVRIPKRVGFHPSVLAVDPPQQIPPVNPRKGCVQIVNGEVKVSPDRRTEASEFAYIDPSHSTMTAFAAKRAHENATRLHSGLQKGGFLGLFKDEDDAVVPQARAKVDGVAHGSGAVGSAGGACTTTSGEDDYETDTSSETTLEATPEQLYTRCCHLREILPIKSMLKQLQNQVAPIPELHIVNVKPTLVEVLAFTDFIRIMPVVWVRMDSLVLDDKMVRILLSSLAKSTHLSKLSFANTPLSAASWSALCAFVLERGLISLDVSCAPDTRIPHFDRAGVDWDLLAGAIQQRSPDSIVLSGTRVPMSHWRNLATSKLKSLVMANNDLDQEYLGYIVRWMCQPDCDCLAIDLAGNNLSGCYDLLREMFATKALRRFNAADTCIGPEFFGVFGQDVPLRSLELSSNPQLFSDIKPLTELLPRLVNLRRLELNDCGLTSPQVVELCQALVRCPTLVHLSLQGSDLDETAAAALCVVVHTSSSLAQVDVDNEGWPDQFRNQLAAYCIQNINGDKHGAGEIHSFEQELEILQRDIVHTREIPAHVLDKIVAMRNRYRGELAELLRLRQTRALNVQEQEQMFKLFFYDSSIQRLITQFREAKREPAQEDVYTFDTPRAGLSRAASSSSVMSLKQLENEEGKVHKINTWLMADDKHSLSPEALKSLMDENDLSDTTLQRIKEYNASDLDREIQGAR